VIASWSMAISPTPWCRRCGGDLGRGGGLWLLGRDSHQGLVGASESMNLWSFIGILRVWSLKHMGV
jgi:hypothetical protein